MQETIDLHRHTANNIINCYYVINNIPYTYLAEIHQKSTVQRNFALLVYIFIIALMRLVICLKCLLIGILS